MKIQKRKIILWVKAHWWSMSSASASTYSLYDWPAPPLHWSIIITLHRLIWDIIIDISENERCHNGLNDFLALVCTTVINVISIFSLWLAAAAPPQQRPLSSFPTHQLSFTTLHCTAYSCIYTVMYNIHASIWMITPQDHFFSTFLSKSQDGVVQKLHTVQCNSAYW